MIQQQKLLNHDDCNTIRAALTNSFGGCSSRQDSITYKSLTDAYASAKCSIKWPEIYDSLKDVSCIHDIFLKQCREALEQNKSHKSKIINYGIRIIESNDKRSYPLHQEWPDMDQQSFSVIWMSLHDIDANDGGLTINYLDDLNRIRHKHEYNSQGYPILCNQDYYRKNCKLKSPALSEGESIIFNNLTIHGSAKRISKTPRFALIARIEID